MAELDMVQARGDMPEPETGALVKALRDRLPDAYARLYDRFAPGIRRFAAAFVAGDVQLAEDLVIDTLMGVARDIRRFDSRRSTLAAWVYGIARRRIWGELRRRNRIKSVPASAQVSLEALGEVADQLDLAAETSARLDAQRKITETAKRLSETEMEVLVLSCVDELSAREVGQVVRRSEGAVRVILHRARKKAREGMVRDEE
ncbi:MAG: sigma-70 family RNA polymerase sigma factor [Proteobacteria bacterium]|nr:sigma-70 family RNA polymerase sigma factor [Pseudomonadota bacterium]